MSELQGAAELVARLDRLENKETRRWASKAVDKGLTQIAKGIRSEVPTSVSRKTQRRLKKAVGKRHKKNKHNGIKETKAGLNVGKKLSSPARMPHAHLIVLGSSERTRRRIGGAVRKHGSRLNPSQSYSTGRMPALARDMVPQGARKSAAAAERAIIQSLQQAIKKAGSA